MLVCYGALKGVPWYQNLLFQDFLKNTGLCFHPIKLNVQPEVKYPFNQPPYH